MAISKNAFYFWKVFASLNELENYLHCNNKNAIICPNNTLPLINLSLNALPICVVHGLAKDLFMRYNVDTIDVEPSEQGEIFLNFVLDYVSFSGESLFLVFLASSDSLLKEMHSKFFNFILDLCYNGLLSILLGDSFCQDFTNNGECGWDGGDCCVRRQGRNFLLQWLQMFGPKCNLTKKLNSL